MDFSLPADDDPRRREIREWLESNPDPNPHQLAESGLVAPGWPSPWGVSAGAEQQLIISLELEAAGIDPHQHNPIGIGWAGPTILAAGTEAQKERFLRPLLQGDEYWCQLFSEPEAGSDLASLETRAVRDGDHYVVNGQKVWTTWAGQADYGILLARTDPTARRHSGISYLLCPMRQDGIDIRPIREMTGRSHFNEVFFTDALVPVDNLLGVENDGWRLAKVTLGNERVSLSSGGVLWGMGPTTAEVIGGHRPLFDLGLRDEAVNLHIEAEVLRLLGYRVVSALIHGIAPGPEVAVKKLLADRHGQKVMEWSRSAAGASAMVVDGDPTWGYLFSRALTIGGGTSEVLRNIIAEQILGLPRGPEAGRRQS